MKNPCERFPDNAFVIHYYWLLLLFLRVVRLLIRCVVSKNEFALGTHKRICHIAWKHGRIGRIPLLHTKNVVWSDNLTRYQIHIITKMRNYVSHLSRYNNLFELKKLWFRALCFGKKRIISVHLPSTESDDVTQTQPKIKLLIKASDFVE